MKNIIRKFKNKAHKALAVIFNVYYGKPSKSLKVIGVTGTDGKTTTSHLIYHILRKGGFKVALISTLGAYIDGESFETGFHVTTPSSQKIQKYILMAKNKGCTHLVLEVTSHALDQNRVWGIDFFIGVLTNITPEHLDYHKNFEEYVHTKLRLLKNSRITVVNSSGDWFDYVEKFVKGELRTYSLHKVVDGDLTLDNIPFKIKTNLVGEFNLENILAAIVVARLLKIKDNLIAKAIESYRAPTGRQQEIINSNGIKIIIDFAHTPNSFKRILPEFKKTTEGLMIHVFGAAGERDNAKRIEMGKIASEYDDIIILTSEDPRSEKVTNINKQIREGIPESFDESIGASEKLKKLYEIEDREKAIAFAVSLAAKNDTVIITGKGHERSMNYGGKEIAWSDEEVVKKYIKSHEI